MDDADTGFAAPLLAAIGAKMPELACSHGAFVLVALCEAASTGAEAKAALAPAIPALEAEKANADSKLKGVGLLLDVIKGTAQPRQKFDKSAKSKKPKKSKGKKPVKSGK